MLTKIRFTALTDCLIVCLFFCNIHVALALQSISTTTLEVSICGDGLINSGEECDVPSETGAYSTTILGRQCGTNCRYGPYCGDGKLQTLYNEECDDGNNTDHDFCAADCTTEFTASGGGKSGGGGSSGSGGSAVQLGTTQITIQGKGYPNTTVSILIDAVTVGTVRTNSRGDFTFTTETDPGTASLSFWANDNKGTRSALVNTTFDVTQGAVTNLDGILIPPTIRITNTSINPGDIVLFSGQTVPNVIVEISIDNGKKVLTTTSDALGNWSKDFDSSTISANSHTVKARFISGTTEPRTESTYGSSLSLNIGVEGKATSNSDLNRDGKVNLIDFSILIFWWGSTGGNSSPPADINQNAKVGLEDFSILLFNWTG